MESARLWEVTKVLLKLMWCCLMGILFGWPGFWGSAITLLVIG